MMQIPEMNGYLRCVPSIIEIEWIIKDCVGIYIQIRNTIDDIVPQQIQQSTESCEDTAETLPQSSPSPLIKIARTVRADPGFHCSETEHDTKKAMRSHERRKKVQISRRKYRFQPENKQSNQTVGNQHDSIEYSESYSPTYDGIAEHCRQPGELPNLSLLTMAPCDNYTSDLLSENRDHDHLEGPRTNNGQHNEDNCSILGLSLSTTPPMTPISSPEAPHTARTTL